jgi:hypothetical protein
MGSKVFFSGASVRQYYIIKIDFAMLLANNKMDLNSSYIVEFKHIVLCNI